MSVKLLKNMLALRKTACQLSLNHSKRNILIGAANKTGFIGKLELFLDSFLGTNIVKNRQQELEQVSKNIVARLPDHSQLNAETYITLHEDLEDGYIIRQEGFETAIYTIETVSVNSSFPITNSYTNRECLVFLKNQSDYVDLISDLQLIYKADEQGEKFVQALPEIIHDPLLQLENLCAFVSENELEFKKTAKLKLTFSQPINKLSPTQLVNELDEIARSNNNNFTTQELITQIAKFSIMHNDKLASKLANYTPTVLNEIANQLPNNEEYQQFKLLFTSLAQAVSSILRNKPTQAIIDLHNVHATFVQTSLTKLNTHGLYVALKLAQQEQAEEDLLAIIHNIFNRLEPFAALEPGTRNVLYVNDAKQYQIVQEGQKIFLYTGKPLCFFNNQLRSEIKHLPDNIAYKHWLSSLATINTSLTRTEQIQGKLTLLNEEIQKLDSRIKRTSIGDRNLGISTRCELLSKKKSLEQKAYTLQDELTFLQRKSLPSNNKAGFMVTYSFASRTLQSLFGCPAITSEYNLSYSLNYLSHQLAQRDSTEAGTTLNPLTLDEELEIRLTLQEIQSKAYFAAYLKLPKAAHCKHKLEELHLILNTRSKHSTIIKALVEKEVYEFSDTEIEALLKLNLNLSRFSELNDKLTWCAEQHLPNSYSNFMHIERKAHNQDKSYITDIIALMESSDAAIAKAPWIINFPPEDKFATTGKLPGGLAQDLYGDKGLDIRCINDYSCMDEQQLKHKVEFLNSHLIGDAFSIKQKQLFWNAYSKLWQMAKFNYLATDLKICYQTKTTMPNAFQIRYTRELKEYCLQKAQEVCNLDEELLIPVKNLFLHADYAW
jgi:hypothetical protein